MATKVLMTSNGDKVSRNIAIQLAKHVTSKVNGIYIRLVLLGDEASLRSIVDHIRVSVDGAFPVLLIGVDMEDDSEEAFYVAVQKAWTCLGSLDAFINCYTYQGKMQDILQVPEGEFKKITKINLTAPWYLLKAVASTMKEHGTGGSIVFLATIASGERGLYPGAYAYATAAAGIHQLVRELQFQLSSGSLSLKLKY
ncbi:unnamed protein product [Eruca vesicaria subsp. sativa]|uniref:Uncharacterized protein n=1 Tax=Eruca vesicaria subsp. sativa TaxID=29727 RepID=A0ABC8J2R9_ERUVS|nr:unnamed protein product [Eruca vesicaria subsp. sativa]